jgi:hypothetical protein
MWGGRRRSTRIAPQPGDVPHEDNAETVRYNAVDPTLAVDPPRRSEHVILKVDAAPDLRSRRILAATEGSGLDLRATGRFTLGRPDTDPSGAAKNGCERQSGAAAPLRTTSRGLRDQS